MKFFDGIRKYKKLLPSHKGKESPMKTRSLKQSSKKKSLIERMNEISFLSYTRFSIKKQTFFEIYDI